MQHLGTAAFVLQLVLVGAIPALEGRLGSAPGRPHVEELGREGCPPIHDAAHCQVCRVVRAPFAPSFAGPAPAGPRKVAMPAGMRSTQPALAACRGINSTRAPPV
jgi:hypothetical protein